MSAASQREARYWEKRHEAARMYPRDGHETAIVRGIQCLSAFSVSHLKAYESPIARDVVLGVCWFDMWSALRGMLNGELGRLDGGSLDTELVSLALAAGYTETDIDCGLVRP